MNKKMKRIYIITSVILIIISFFGIIISKRCNYRKIEKELISITTKYYDNEFVKLMPNELKRNNILKIELTDLEQLGKDVTFFKEKKCDLKNTYVILTYNKKTNYDIESHLTCK
ncbi:MAG: hypothetical protein J6B98_04285 [Bacilli bacterium]|nr:hypothetical protein [Bacilli bacterium]